MLLSLISYLCMHEIFDRWEQFIKLLLHPPPSIYPHPNLHPGLWSQKPAFVPTSPSTPLSNNHPDKKFKLTSTFFCWYSLNFFIFCQILKKKIVVNNFKYCLNCIALSEIIQFKNTYSQSIPTPHHHHTHVYPTHSHALCARAHTHTWLKQNHYS